MYLIDAVKVGFKSVMVIFALLALLVIMTSCSSLDKLAQKGADEIAPLIDSYCYEVRENVRVELRAKINAKTDGHRIKIICASDRG